MSRPRFALLNAAHNDANARRNFRREVDADLVEFDANASEFPETFDFDGVIVTGSRSSVYWDEEWIPQLVDWVAEAADRGLPVLGICFGHQVLAEALGGRVDGMGGYEIGYRGIDLTDSGVEDDLFADFDERFTAFTTHQDAVVDLPPGADLLAENDYGVHAFRKGRCWGTQFHPEYDMETAEMITRGKDLDDDRLEQVLDGVNPDNYGAACEVKRLFDNFADYARRLARERDAGPVVGDD